MAGTVAIAAIDPINARRENIIVASYEAPPEGTTNVPNVPLGSTLSEHGSPHLAAVRSCFSHEPLAVTAIQPFSSILATTEDTAASLLAALANRRRKSILKWIVP